MLGFVNGAILELDSDPPIMMARLLTFADHQIRHAFATRRTLPEFVIQQELSVPDPYADLGDRQLNEILTVRARPSAVHCAAAIHTPAARGVSFRLRVRIRAPG